MGPIAEKLHKQVGQLKTRTDLVNNKNIRPVLVYT